MEMPTVELKLDPADLPEQMSAMRLWLDQRQCETSAFNCHRASGGVLVSVVFSVAEEAEAFAEHFAGRSTGTERGAAGS
jgi:hypothetical protein